MFTFHKESSFKASKGRGDLICKAGTAVTIHRVIFNFSASITFCTDLLKTTLSTFNAIARAYGTFQRSLKWKLKTQGVLSSESSFFQHVFATPPDQEDKTIPHMDTSASCTRRRSLSPRSQRNKAPKGILLALTLLGTLQERVLFPTRVCNTS